MVEAMWQHAQTMYDAEEAVRKAFVAQEASCATATRFCPGEVDRLGFIRMSHTEKAVNGIVLVTPEQAKRAARYGWKKIKHPDAKNGLVAVERR